MNDSPLTQKQADILEYLLFHITNYGCAPTHSEIATRFAMTQTNVSQRLYGLEHRGFVKRSPSMTRGLRVLRNVAGNPVALKFIEVIETSKSVI